MMFVNETGQLWAIVVTGTTYITGSVTVTLMMVLMLLFAACIMFNIPIEWTAIVLLPLCIVLASQYQLFLETSLVIVIYLGLVFTKNFLLSTK